jgi:hypothetical protein
MLRGAICAPLSAASFSDLATSALAQIVMGPRSRSPAAAGGVTSTPTPSRAGSLNVAERVTRFCYRGHGTRIV